MRPHSDYFVVIRPPSWQDKSEWETVRAPGRWQVQYSPCFVPAGFATQHLWMFCLPPGNRCLVGTLIRRRAAPSHQPFTANMLIKMSRSISFDSTAFAAHLSQPRCEYHARSRSSRGALGLEGYSTTSVSRHDTWNGTVPTVAEGDSPKLLLIESFKRILQLGLDRLLVHWNESQRLQAAWYPEVCFPTGSCTHGHQTQRHPLQLPHSLMHRRCPASGELTQTPDQESSLDSGTLSTPLAAQASRRSMARFPSSLSHPTAPMRTSAPQPPSASSQVRLPP
jgi:hypothetical protein